MPKKIGIIGGGSSGVIAATELLKRGIDAEIVIYEKSMYIGGFPRGFTHLPANSNLNNLLRFFDRASGLAINREEFKQKRKELEKSTAFSNLAAAAKWLHESALNKRVRTELSTDITNIQYLQKGWGFLVEGSQNESPLEERVDILIGAQGIGTQRKPYASTFSSEMEIPYRDAMNGTFDCRSEDILVIGSRHSAAIAVANAQKNGARHIRIVTQEPNGLPFRKYKAEDDSNIVENRYTGIRGKAVQMLEDALGQGSWSAITRSAFEEDIESYKNVRIIYGAGFNPNPLYIEEGNISKPVHVQTEGSINQDPPRAVFPDGRIVDNCYLLGIGNPQLHPNWTTSDGKRLVEEKGAPIIGALFTYFNATAIAHDIEQKIDNPAYEHI